MAVGFVIISAHVLVDILDIKAVMLVNMQLCTEVVSHLLQLFGDGGFGIHVRTEHLTEFHLYLQTVAPYVFTFSAVDLLAGFSVSAYYILLGGLLRPI